MDEPVEHRADPLAVFREDPHREGRAQLQLRLGQVDAVDLVEAAQEFPPCLGVVEGVRSLRYWKTTSTVPLTG